MFVAVRVEDERTLTESLFQTVGVELRLLLPNTGITPRSFCFDKTERFSVIAPEGIINKPDLLLVWHSFNTQLGVMPRLRKRPASFFQQQIDEIIARLRFRVVVRVRRRDVRLLCLCDFGPQTL